MSDTKNNFTFKCLVAIIILNSVWHHKYLDTKFLILVCKSWSHQIKKNCRFKLICFLDYKSEIPFIPPKDFFEWQNNKHYFPGWFLVSNQFKIDKVGSILAILKFSYQKCFFSQIFSIILYFKQSLCMQFSETLVYFYFCIE